MTVDVFVEIGGWIGMLCLLGAYGMTMVIEGVSDTLRYHVLNIVGSIGIGVNAYWNGALPPAVMNAIWVCFAIFAVRRIVALSRTKA